MLDQNAIRGLVSQLQSRVAFAEVAGQEIRISKRLGSLNLRRSTAGLRRTSSVDGRKFSKDRSKNATLLLQKRDKRLVTRSTIHIVTCKTNSIPLSGISLTYFQYRCHRSKTCELIFPHFNCAMISKTHFADDGLYMSILSIGNVSRPLYMLFDTHGHVGWNERFRIYHRIQFHRITTFNHSKGVAAESRQDIHLRFYARVCDSELIGGVKSFLDAEGLRQEVAAG